MIWRIMIFGVFIMSIEEPIGLWWGFVECVGLMFSLFLFEDLYMAKTWSQEQILKEDMF